jgi:transposase
LVVHAADIPTSHKESEFKTDKRDALKIAKSLRAGEISGIAIPDKQLQEDRTLVRFRQQLRRDIVRQKCRIKSILAFYSIILPAKWTNSKWTEAMRSWLWNLKLCTDEGTKSIHLHMGMLEYIRGMCINTDGHLRDLSRTKRYEKQVDLLMTVVGFGRLRAIAFLVELGDIQRLKNLDKLSNYVGLVPSSNNSGNKVSQSQLTTRGHKQLRTMLIEAAWTSMNTDPAMAKKYGELKKRMLPQQSIVVIARKLLSRLRYVLVNEVKYEKGIEA